MKNHLLIILTLLFLASCGQVKHDVRFNPIIMQFNKDAEQFGVKVDTSKVRISFDDITHKKILGFKIRINGSDTEAYCSYLKRDEHNDLVRFVTKNFFADYDYAVIKISPSAENYDLPKLEAIVYHELGHCVLNKGHNPDPGTIMYEHSLDFLGSFRYWYLRQLFKNKENDVHSISVKDLNQSNDPDDKLIYEVNYKAFDQTINNQLYFNETTGLYTAKTDRSKGSY